MELFFQAPEAGWFDAISVNVVSNIIVVSRGCRFVKIEDAVECAGSVLQCFNVIWNDIVQISCKTSMFSLEVVVVGPTTL